MSAKKDDVKSEDLVAKEESKKEVSEDVKNEGKDSAEDIPEKEKKKEAAKKDSPRRKPSKIKDDEDDVDKEEDEEEEDDEADTKEKKVPLLDQPLQLSGTRDRKKVKRFTEEFKAEQRETAPVEIPEGRGTKLADIPKIEASIEKFKGEDLKVLHRALFGRSGKVTMIKRNVRKFHGFDFDQDSEQYEKKKNSLIKLDKSSLTLMCTVLDLEKKGSREDIVDRVLTFLLEPKGKVATAGGRSKRSSEANNKVHSDSEQEENEKPAGRTSRTRGKRVSMKESSDEEPTPTSKKKSTDSDQEEESDAAEASPASDEDSDEPKSKKKRGRSNSNSKKPSPKKGSAKKVAPKKPEQKITSKRRKSGDNKSGGESSEDEPLLKKSKEPPTDEEIKTYVKEILEGANLEEITMKTVCKQVYAHYPEFDLAHKKNFIKTTVRSLIST